MAITIDDTPGGGLCVYGEGDRVLARIPTAITGTEGKRTAVSPDKMMLEFCCPVSPQTMVDILDALGTHKPKWIK